VERVLRLPTISAIIFATALPAAAADDSATATHAATYLKIAPSPQTDDGQEPVCSPPTCLLLLPNDIWKRDLMRRNTPIYLNENEVVKDRSRRDALAARFAETPHVEAKIGDTSCLSTLHFVPGFDSHSILSLLHCGF